MQHITDAIAPLEPIYSVMVQQSSTNAPGPLARFAHEVCAVRIRIGEVQLLRRTGENWTTVIKSKCVTGDRNVLVVAGLSTPELPFQSRTKMKALGFSLKHVPYPVTSRPPTAGDPGPPAPTWLRTRTPGVTLSAIRGETGLTLTLRGILRPEADRLRTRTVGVLQFAAWCHQPVNRELTASNTAQPP